MYKIDLHTHSVASKDGGISSAEYRKILNKRIVDMVAVTDHDRIDFAQALQESLGADKVIIGQEVTTTDGDIVGLYLKEAVPAGLSAAKAVRAIKAQDGLVLIPHPFETVRQGIQLPTLESIAESVHMIEGQNGRAVVQNFSAQAIAWGTKHGKQIVANSDAHGYKGVGHTYTTVASLPTDKDALIECLSQSTITFARPPLFTLLYPAINMLKKRIRGSKTW